MKKITPSRDQIDALLAYTSNNERELNSARYRLDGFADLVKKGELPKTFLAFEVLDQIALANENGFRDTQYLKLVPECFASETVQIPVFVLNELLNCWDDFIHSNPTKASLAKSFGFAAPKPKSNPIQHIVDKLDKDRYLAQQVFELRIRSWFNGEKLKLVQAFVDVAANEHVDRQTVKNAWYAQRQYYKKIIQELQLPSKPIG